MQGTFIKPVPIGGGGTPMCIVNGTTQLCANPTDFTGQITGDRSIFISSSVTSNILFGYQALLNNTTGSSNTAFGYKTLLNNTIGIQNAAFGSSALLINTAGTDNTCVGWNSGISITGSGNVTLGSGSNITSSINNAIALGLNAGVSAPSGIAIGTSSNVAGDRCIAIGDSTLTGSATDTVLIGYNAGSGGGASGSFNIGIGAYSLRLIGSGQSNTAVGFHSMYSTTSGNDNTAIGLFASRINSTGNQNTAVGSNALYLNSSGGDNTALGYTALTFNTASQNTAVGSGTGYNNTTGSDNTTTGFKAGYYVTTGNQNTAFGSQALYGNGPGTTGSDNTCFGYGAGVIIIGGSGNICLGSGSGVGSNINNAITIGKSFTNTVSTTAVIAPNATEVFRTLDPSVGNFSHRLVKTSNATASITLTANIALGGYLEASFAGAITITIDSGANLDAQTQLASNLYVGQSFECKIIASNAAGQITYATAAGITIKGSLTQTINTGRTLLFYRMGAATWDVAIL